MREHLLSDFDYDLPPELIAQTPRVDRAGGRLLALIGNQTRHLAIRDLSRLLDAGDLLVLNDTRVLKARLFGRLASSGSVEVLLCEEVAPRRWLALVRPARKLKIGTRIVFAGTHGARVVEIQLDGARVLEFSGDPRELMDSLGEIPLPPYIRRPLADPNRYQTVFGVREGAVAASTAGLHLTTDLLEEIGAAGVESAKITLHIGPGTFRPVTRERLEDHRMHAEWFEVPAATAAAINRVLSRNGRVVAVGTTVTRALETAAMNGGEMAACMGRTDLFLRPGAQFRVVGGLITNFHLPRSTLLILVCAFAEALALGGTRRILEAYAAAVGARYRFFSFGDAMILLSGKPRVAESISPGRIAIR